MAGMTPPDLVLVADIGGTHSRFGLVEAGKRLPHDIAALDNDHFAGPREAMRHYLGATGGKPVRGVLALAGPMENGTVHLTNRADWSFRPTELAAEFAMREIAVVNDFAALAEALPYLEELTPLGPNLPLTRATKVVFGPGTGLGVAGLIYHKGEWIVAPSEGGHIEFAATNEREAAIFSILRRDFGRVSAELVVSGEGIERLDMAVAELDGLDMAQREGRVISEAARMGEARGREVMTLFFDTLARFAGDMALTFVAHGGVYIGGGVLPKTLDLMDIDRFRAIFTAKRPHETLVAGIPTVMIASETPTLTGCAAIAARGALD